MQAKINTGTYKVISIGKMFFAVFEFNDGEVLLLSKAYTLARNAEKRLQNHCNSVNVILS